jgi:hypothetical protein
MLAPSQALNEYLGHPTPIRTPIRADIAQVDSIFGLQSLYEAQEPGMLYTADGEEDGPYSRRSNRR